MMNHKHYLILIGLICTSIRVQAVTTREADILNLNGIQDGDTTSPRGIGKGTGQESKDAAVTESQENRSFFKPSDADRRGTFYPSGPPGTSSGFGPNYHASGNGYSFGSSSGGEYPSYGGSYPHRPSTSISSHGGYGAGLGGNYPLSPPTDHGGGAMPPHAAALKSLLLPIAGVALLGAAAVLAKSHPVLLQLGVVGSGKRKRRSLNLNIEPTMQHGIYPENPFIEPPTHKIVKKNF